MSAPDHPSLPNFVDYLHRYAEHFNVLPHIRASTKLVHLVRVPVKSGSGSDVQYVHRAALRSLDAAGKPSGPPQTVLADRVIITSGLHVTPNIPLIPGLNLNPTAHSPEWMHSSSYKSRSQVSGKSVLVLGAGETGMDVAYESLLSPAKKVWMGVRGGFLSFPKVLNHFTVLGSTFDGNLPIDGLITNLFETAYVHPWVAASHLRWFVSDFVVKRVLWFLTGTTAGCNQWAGELPPERQGRAYVFLNKSAKAMPYINKPYQQLSRLHRWIAHYQDPPAPPGVDDPTIHLVPFPTGFDDTGRAILPPPPKHRAKEVGWKQECRPDMVVLCTGYKQDFGWAEGYETPDQADVRGVMSSEDDTVGYIGFLRPGVGMSFAIVVKREPSSIPRIRQDALLHDAKVQVPFRPWRNSKSSYTSSSPPAASRSPHHRSTTTYCTRHKGGFSTASTTARTWRSSRSIWVAHRDWESCIASTGCLFCSFTGKFSTVIRVSPAADVASSGVCSSDDLGTE